MTTQKEERYLPKTEEEKIAYFAGMKEGSIDWMEYVRGRQALLTELEEYAHKLKESLDEGSPLYDLAWDDACDSFLTHLQSLKK